MTRLLSVSIVLLLLLAAAFGAAGFHTVPPGEVAVVRHLGRLSGHPREPGLIWVWPLGIDRVDRVPLGASLRLVIGESGVPGPAAEPGAGEFLTGDLNLLRTRAVIRYRVTDPIAYALAADPGPTPLLSSLAEAALASRLTRDTIDSLLLANRRQVGDDTVATLNSALARAHLGIEVLTVSLADTCPPGEVAADFNLAQSAPTEAAQRQRAAQQRAADILAIARANASSVVASARAAANRTRLDAVSRVERMALLRAQVDRDRPTTLNSLRAEAIQRALPTLRRAIVMPPDQPLDLSVLAVDSPLATPAGPPAPATESPRP